MIAGVAVVLAVAALFGTMAVKGQNISVSGTPTPIVGVGPTRSGIGCDAMGVSYHVHAHLAIYDHGKLVPWSPDYGHNYNHDCLYWMHVHDTTGIIHIEAPHTIKPTLKEWFAVIQQPLDATHIGNSLVKPGDKVRIWVNQKPYHGSVASVVLKQHTDVTIEIGGPLKPPVKFNFAAHQV